MMTNLEKYIIARWCYAIGEDMVEDIEYRYLESKIREESPECGLVDVSWSDDPCPLDLLKKYDMMEYYRDIKFLYKSESIRSIIDETTYKSQFRYLNKRTRGSYKLDGFNIQVNYYNGGFISAETRGRTGNSLNASVVQALIPQKIPYLGKVKITGELVIPNDKWKLYQLETGNVSQRNSVSTALARGDVNYLAYLAFNIQVEGTKLVEDQYEILNKIGFKTPNCIYFDTFEGLEKAMKLFGKRAKVYNYPTDGFVVENDELQVALRIYEWQEEELKSYVTGYLEKRGLYGDAMVALIKPINIEGSTQSKVSVTNIQYIKDCNLEIGSPIAFDLRSKANCVLNSTRTIDLQSEYDGRFEEYREVIDTLG